MKLKTLLKDLPILSVKGSQSTTINGICSNSQKAKPGDLFIARKGISKDGAEFIPDAILSGAVAIVTDLYNPFYDNVVQIIVEDVNLIEPLLAARFHKNPSKHLFTVGITGTNGKTTSAYLIKQMLDGIQEPAGYIGTLGTIIKDHVFPLELTTPDSVTMQQLLREMVDEKCTSAVMEVSSHAIHQGRVNEIDFDVCVFTNLSEDHLDYHRTMKEYATAKAHLFTKQSSIPMTKPRKRYAIINRDDAFSFLMEKHARETILTFGIENDADIMAKDIALESGRTTFNLSYLGESVRIESNLLGRFNVYNLLTVAAVGIAKGLDLLSLQKLLSQSFAIPGRMQEVPNQLRITILVDFAHTPDALKKSITALNEIKEKKIITVFGCGGNRDKEKRPKMMEIAHSLSDHVFVTTDNARFEDPKEIVNQMIGSHHYENATIELDRKKAIAHAIELAKPGDIVLIAGKGHENEQIFQNMTLEFNDYQIAKELCEHLEKGSFV